MNRTANPLPPSLPVDSPLKLPESAVQRLRRRSPGNVDLPRRARRQQEFNEGRDVAAAALAEQNCFEPVAAASDRSPVWPTGFVGSISHSDNFCWAAVGRSDEFRSIGIDTEPIAEQKTFQLLQDEIGSDAEWELGHTAGLTELQTFTVIFSAKESIYKCLYPLNPVFFGFDAVRVIDIDSHSLTLKMQQGTHAEFLIDGFLEIRYHVSGSDVFTACWLANESILGGC